MSNAATYAIAKIELEHLATGKICKTGMFVDSFEQQVKPNWSSEQVYGRMDPIMTYQNTQRTFTMILSTPGLGESLTDGQKARVVAAGGACGTSGFSTENKLNVSGITAYLKDIKQMYQMMYPYYEGRRDQAFLKSAPLLRLSAGGLTGGGGGVAEQNKLVFAPTAFTVTAIANSKGPAVSVGSIEHLRFAGNSDGYKVTIQGTVMHTDRVVGWVPVGLAGISFAVPNFPYTLAGQGTAAVGTTSNTIPRAESTPESDATTTTEEAILGTSAGIFD